MSYRRVGSCLGCGQHCCTLLALPVVSAHDTVLDVEAYPQDERLWLSYHEGVTVTDTAVLLDREPFLLVPAPQGGRIGMYDSRCKHLTPEGKCAVYGTPQRPALCGEWPTRPLHLLLMRPEGVAACGYEFITE